jgi:Mor family transcriptional regulator
MATGIPPKTGRNKRLVKDKLNGLTFRELAKKYKISSTFAKRVYYRDLSKFGNLVDKKI